MSDYRRLKVWEKSHQLAIDTNKMASGIRGSAKASLRNQMIRAAMSITANIVEGRAQRTEKDFARFINYAVGSAAELEYHLLIAKDIQAIAEGDFQAISLQLAEVRKMLHGLSKCLVLRA